MTIGSRHMRRNCDDFIKIFHNNEPLMRINSTKLLGLNFDSNLNWDNHISHICKKISALLSILHHNKHYMNQNTKLLFYNAYILPHFDYCSVIWGSTTKTNLDRLLKLQKYAARSILNVNPRTPSQILFEKLNWMPIDKRIQFRKCTMLFKCLNNQTPEYMSTKFTKCSELTRNITLRSNNSNKLCVPRAKTSYYSRSFQLTATTSWNSLPNDITSSPSLNSFKNQLTSHYLRQRNVIVSLGDCLDRMYAISIFLFHSQISLACNGASGKIRRTSLTELPFKRFIIIIIIMTQLSQYYI